MVETIGSFGLSSAIALYFGTFLHEDVAILAGSYLVVEMGLSPSLALIALYLGIVSGDVLLYGLGRFARRSARLRRLLISRRVEHLSAWLDRHLLLTIVVCRVLPGTVSPVFVACGWFGLSFRRFLATTMVSSFVYTAALLSVVMVLGEIVMTHLGQISWAIAGGLLLIAALIAASRPNWNLFSRMLDSPEHRALSPAPESNAVLAGCQGMPPLNRLESPASLAERIPPPLFYIPLVLQWLWLGIRNWSLTLPTVADPLIQAGGLLGESKSDCLRQVDASARRWFAPFTTVTCSAGPGPDCSIMDRALAGIAATGLEFPMVVKPDIGWRGFGVRLVADPDELSRYLAAFPDGETVILQQNVAFDGEVAIFYVRAPEEPHGRIFSMTFRYFPYVVGDGRSTLRELIGEDVRANWKSQFHHGIDELHCGLTEECLDSVPRAGTVQRLSFIGSNRVGGLYRDAQPYITPALTDRIDEIAKAIPEFWFGRFDARFDTIEALMRGEDFKIVEINGAGAEAIHVWDPDMSLMEAWRILFRQQALMFEIARKNRARGFEPIGFRELCRYQRRQQRLIPLYPPSN